MGTEKATALAPELGGEHRDTESAPPAVVQSGDYVSMRPEACTSKRSHACCGCCCDTRRAVKIVNIVSLSFAATSLCMLCYFATDGYYEQLDDDVSKEEWEEANFGITITMVIVGMICNSLGIYGAIKFNSVCVVLSGIWYATEAVHSLIYQHYGFAIMPACFLYPHVVLYQEMKSGIMSAANYPSEEQCCSCCT